MIEAPIPDYEKARMCAVDDLQLLDTKGEERFDRITKFATFKFFVPISTITIVAGDREWFKSAVGTTLTEGPRKTSFCGHALLHEDIYIVEDASKDPIFSDNPMVTGEPHIRFYAGKALKERKSGLPVGVFCIKDTKPRKMTLEEIDEFLKLAEQAEDEINKKTS